MNNPVETGNYHKLKSKQASLSTQYFYAQLQENIETKIAPLVKATWDESTVNIHFVIPKAVYVEIINGDEQIVYHSKVMTSNKIYEITYKGEKWGLRKTDSDVEFMKFHRKE